MAMATRLFGFLGTIAAAAAFWGIALGPLTDKTLDIARNNSSVAEASTGAQYVQQAADWTPLWVLLILFVAMIAASVYRSQRYP